MNDKTIHLIYFSPTQTSRTILTAIAAAMDGKAGLRVNLTLGAPEKLPVFSDQDVVLVGMPVYGGRLPTLAVERFQPIQGGGAFVVPVVVYGNRHYDDALIELFDLCREQGFRPIAAGAFLAEHSFSTKELPLSKGRPDATDLEKARAFGQRIKLGELKEVPGNRPYKPAMSPAGSATSVDAAACTRCGKCLEVCPTRGMTLSESAAEADPDHCVWCLACLRACPVSARTLTHETVRGAANKLNDLFSERREPETFLP